MAAEDSMSSIVYWLQAGAMLVLTVVAWVLLTTRSKKTRQVDSDASGSAATSAATAGATGGEDADTSATATSSAASTAPGAEAAGPTPATAAAARGPAVDDEESTPQRVSLRIIYGTQLNKAKQFAEQLVREAFAMNINGVHFDVSAVDMKDYDQDNLEHEQLVVFLLSTYTGGTPPPAAATFCSWLADMALDFRVSRDWLANIRFVTYGLGNSEYDEDWCRAAVRLDGHMRDLGAMRLAKVGKGDDSADMEEHFRAWTQRIWPAFVSQYARACGSKGSSATGQSAAVVEPCGTCGNPDGEGSCSSGAGAGEGAGAGTSTKQRRRRGAGGKKQAAAEAKASGELEPTVEDLINDKMLDYLSSDEEDALAAAAAAADGDGLVDMEDIGAMLVASKAARAQEEQEEAKGGVPVREMVTPAQRRSLTKEGYKIIGSHSAVKLCRWTKHQLRGRGGCYKHTCYNITSYQCMEATPSLACANKCVFCWRHHKNPIGRKWRWKTDSPQLIVDEAIARHQKMIKEVKGVPGVRMDRWHAAFTVKHCALSLVGEPIMYPHINELLGLLHDKEISTFLVTNAQFPEHIATLDPVTQLYVSIDAATKDSLKAVDRPLFKDFWERFLSSLDELRKKGQRTVYRMTLVKAWNMTEVDDYVALIKRGRPDFIEIKAVTYCGKSDGSSLTMKNVPYHEEVRNFSELICEKLGGDYGLACEHSHSNLVLLAKMQFNVDGAWHTWIDYPKFHELNRRYKEDGTTFSAMDYIAKTAEWAVYNAAEEGFDPVETRFRRSRTGKLVEVEYKASSSGCG